jgi:drug/metabolite transporter (DMT)-like permease
MPTMRPLTANLILLGCAAIWGLAFLFQKSAMEHVGPLQFVAARCAVAAVVLAPLALIEHRAAFGSPAIAGMGRTIVGAGLLFLVAAYLQQRGIVTASVTNTAFLTTLYVVATPLIAWALIGSGQRPGRHVWMAVVLSSTGAWLLGGGGSLGLGAGDALVIASTLFWAWHVVVLAMAAPMGRPLLLMCGQFAVAAALASAGALAFEGIEAGGIANAAVEIAFVGVLSSAVTFTLFAMALRATSAAVATIIASTEAPLAAIGASILLGERLTATGLAGAVLMLAAVLVAQRSAPHKR